MYPSRGFKICFPLVGMSLVHISILTGNVLIILVGFFNLKFQYLFAVNCQTEKARNLKIWLKYVGMILYHCIFLEVDLRTHEPPPPPQRPTSSGKDS